MTRRVYLLSAALLAVLPAFRPYRAPHAARADPKAAIDSFVERRIAADSFSGTVLVARNGQVVYQRAAGMAVKETSVPMTLDTKLQIASTTKLFTHIAIRQLEQAGKLAMTDTVGKFLPKYPNATVRSRVTVEQLLRHRSGVGSFWNEKFMARHADIRSVNDYLELFQNDSLLFEPGTNEAYSNGGYVLLGAIIERASGQSYHDYLKERIFAPAGMTETLPCDNRTPRQEAAVGYTTQPLDGPAPGDRRLAGPGAPRPGYSTPSATAPAQSGGEGPRLRIMGADGRELSAEEARAAMARRAAAGGVRRPNTSILPGLASPAGDYYSTVGDFLRLANAIVGRRLLDSAHTVALLGGRYASGTDFRQNGGGPGVNAEFSLYPSGEMMIVLSNYDPPSATAVAQFIRSLIAPTPAASPSPAAAGSLRTEIEALHADMVAAFKSAPSSVARFYTDDASILGGGSRWVGREQIDRYWSQGGPSDWTLEVLEVGGDSQSPWVRGRSTLVGQGGRRMVTDYVGILKRQPDGRLRFYIDMFVGAPSMSQRPPS